MASKRVVGKVSDPLIPFYRHMNEAFSEAVMEILESISKGLAEQEVEAPVQDLATMLPEGFKLAPKSKAALAKTKSEVPLPDIDEDYCHYIPGRAASPKQCTSEKAEGYDYCITHLKMATVYKKILKLEAPPDIVGKTKDKGKGKVQTTKGKSQPAGKAVGFTGRNASAKRGGAASLKSGTLTKPSKTVPVIEFDDYMPDKKLCIQKETNFIYHREKAGSTGEVVCKLVGGKYVELNQTELSDLEALGIKQSTKSIDDFLDAEEDETEANGNGETEDVKTEEATDIPEESDTEETSADAEQAEEPAVASKKTPGLPKLKTTSSRKIKG